MAAELLAGTAREHIARLWPEHLEHLAPEGNRMGQGHIDPDEGVVCNCGEVLGFPVVQDEADYATAEPEQPDTSGAQTGEPDDGPDIDNYDAHTEPPPGVVPDGDMPDNYQDPDMLEDLEGQSAPTPDPWQAESDAQHEFDTEMRERFERNPFDPEARAWVYGQRDLTAPDEAQASPYGPDEPPWDDPPQGAWAPPGSSNGEQAGEPKGVMPYRDPGVVEMQDPLAARVVVIDPSQPYTPQDVEQQLLDIAARLERGMHYQRYWEERAFAAKSEYTLKAARARLEATGAKDQRDAYVTVKCEPEWRELELADAMVRSMRETMHTLRSLQTGYQTVARSVAESMRVPAGSRGRP
jgi:hypothetical protein